MSSGEIEVDLYLSRHPLWSTLTSAPPEGVRYIPHSGLWGKAYLALSGLARVRRLAHFCNGVKLAPGRRWVADMESAKVFFRRYEEMLDPDRVASAQRRIETGECVALLPLTEAARRTITRLIKTRAVRVKVIYPTVHTDAPALQAERREIILFVGGSWRDGSFEAKGGREVAEAWLRIRKSYPELRFLMLSSPPPALAEALGRAGIEVGSLPRKTLLTEIYPRTRVVVLPSMMDTVGYSVLEGMYFGAVPVVSDHFAMPELVGDAGLTVRAPTGIWRPDGTPNLSFREELAEGPFEELTESILDRLHQLLADDGLWSRLSEACWKRLRSPPLSVEHRNRELRRIYEEATT